MRTQHRALRVQIPTIGFLNMGGTAKYFRPMAIYVAMGFFIFQILWTTQTKWYGNITVMVVFQSRRLGGKNG